MDVARRQPTVLEHKDEHARGTQSPRPPRCSPPGGSRSAASASSTAIRISATTRCSRRRANPHGINLLDYGCIRIFPPKFVGGVVDLYNGIRNNDDARIVHAYETWGFRKLSRELIDILNIWARFIYGPLMEDRVRSIADGVKPGEYGRRAGLRGAARAAAKRPGDGAAGVRVHGSCCDRTRRACSCICARSSIFTGCSKRRSRSSPSSTVAEAAARGARARRPGNVGIDCSATTIAGWTSRSGRVMGQRGAGNGGGLMLVRLGLSLLIGAAILAPGVARAGCSEELSKLMSKDTEKLTTRFQRISKQIEQSKGARRQAAPGAMPDRPPAQAAAGGPACGAQAVRLPQGPADGQHDRRHRPRP